MNIRRIVPDITSNEPDLGESFYVDFLGLKKAMDLGWIATYVSPTNPTAQVNVLRNDNPSASPAGISVEVDDVDRAFHEANARGLRIVYPLTNEPWGVRRFFVMDPNGVVINVMCHLPSNDKAGQ